MSAVTNTLPTDPMALAAQYMLGTYSPQLLLTKGRGSRVWDADGKAYLDFCCGISVCNLGHCHPQVTAAVQRQAAKLVHVSNLYCNEVQPALAAALARHSFGGRAFFCNSGAEANEALIKFARKWGNPLGRHEIICMRHSFHGRTLGTLAATDKPAIREGFGPDLPGFSFVPFNDSAALAGAISDRTAAVLLEPVQGEGGIRPATRDYLEAARSLCDRHGILLLFDEVQCGMGRTGQLFAYQHYGVEPDAMSLAKALGNGFPIGAMLVQRRHEDVLGVGSHATTFGGTALACAAALATLETLYQDDVLANVRDQGAHLQAGLEQLVAKHAALNEVRGLGLILGVKANAAVAPAIDRAVEAGLLVINAGADVLRLLPPLTVSREEVDEALAILDEAFEVL